MTNRTLGYEAYMSNLSGRLWHAYISEFRIPLSDIKPVFQMTPVGVIWLTCYRQYRFLAKVSPMASSAAPCMVAPRCCGRRSMLDGGCMYLYTGWMHGVYMGVYMGAYGVYYLYMVVYGLGP